MTYKSSFTEKIMNYSFYLLLCANPAAPACRRCQIALSLTAFALNQYSQLIAAAMFFQFAIFHELLLS